MEKSPDRSKKTLQRLLLEYLKDSNRSDRQVAKELGVSQPTVSRLKAKLLKEGFVTLDELPDWYIWALLAAIGSSFGLKVTDLAIKRFKK